MTAEDRRHLEARVQSVLSRSGRSHVVWTVSDAYAVRRLLAELRRMPTTRPAEEFTAA